MPQWYVDSLHTSGRHTSGSPRRRLFHEAGEEFTNEIFGDPCYGWYGITCCSKFYPNYDVNRVGEECSSDTGGRMPTLTGPDDFPFGCHSGNTTGTSADEGMCVVVRLALAGNNLDGELPLSIAESFNLRYLQYLDVSNNKLKGEFPPNLATRANIVNRQSLIQSDQYRLQVLYLGDQQEDVAFTYPIGGPKELTCVYVFRCTGLPPDGCTAYGKEYKTSSANIAECVRCQSQIFAILACSGMVIFFFTGAASYAWFTIKHPEATTQFVSTASILLAHMQTMRLIGRMRLTWPQGAVTTMQLFATDAFSFEAARPECIFTGEADDWLSYTIQIARLAVPIVFLLLFIVLRWQLQRMVICLTHVRNKILGPLKKTEPTKRRTSRSDYGPECYRSSDEEGSSSRRELF